MEKLYLIGENMYNNIHWHYPHNGELPTSNVTENKTYSAIPCLTQNTYGQSKILTWNSLYHCWDDEYGDDFYCEAVCGHVRRWCLLAEIEDFLEKQ